MSIGPGGMFGGGGYGPGGPSAESIAVRLGRLLRAEAAHDDARRTIAAMEGTKFWKMRNTWVRTKSAGLRLLKGRAAG